MFIEGRIYRIVNGDYTVPALCLWRRRGTAAFRIDPRDGAALGVSGKVVKRIVALDQVGADGAPRECVPRLGSKPPSDGWWISDIEHKRRTG